MRKRRVVMTYAEHNILVDALKKINFGVGKTTREEIRDRCKEIVNKDISLGAVSRICKLLGIYYKGAWNNPIPQHDELAHRCPACGNKIGVKLYQ